MENSHKRRWFGRTNIIPRPCLFGLHTKRMSDKHGYCGKLQMYVRIKDFCWGYRKIGWNKAAGETWCWNDIFMVRRHGRSCEEMCGKILRTYEKTTEQLYKSRNTVPGWLSIYRRRKWISWRVVHSSQIVLICPYLCWKTWYSMVCEQIWSCSYKMDERLWQALDTFHLLHSSHRWVQAILLCGMHSTTLQIRIVSRFWFCRRPWRLEVNIRRNSVYFRKSHVRTNKLDVQETDLGLTQLYRSWGNFSRCKFTHGGDSRSRSLGFGGWSISFLTEPNQQNQRCKRATVKPVGNSSIKHAKTNSNHEHQSRPDQYWSRSIKRNTFWSQCYVVCFWG